MKFSFKPSPSYRAEQSTSDIMWDVTICLAAVIGFAVVWYGVSFGMQYSFRVLLMTLFAVLAAVLTETAYFALTGSKNIKYDVLHSYGWVTAIILVCITKIDVSYYAVVIATIIAVLFGKMVFGGFGQNIFNPAAFGEAVIMNSFTSSTASSVKDVILSGATPMAKLGSQGWGAGASAISDTLNAYGGFSGMLMGNYASTIGGSCALVIILCACYLIYKKVINWRLTCSFVAAIVIESLIVGLALGSGFDFVVLNLLPGGVLFGAVFMITDPVTAPVSNAGKVLYGICAASLTLILRWKANLPDGVLFSILLMNMLTPAIEKALDGSQIKNYKKMVQRVCIISAIAAVVAVAVGISLKPADDTAAEETAVVETIETEGGQYGSQF